MTTTSDGVAKRLVGMRSAVSKESTSKRYLKLSSLTSPSTSAASSSNVSMISAVEVDLSLTPSASAADTGLNGKNTPAISANDRGSAQRVRLSARMIARSVFLETIFDQTLSMMFNAL